MCGVAEAESVVEYAPFSGPLAVCPKCRGVDIGLHWEPRHRRFLSAAGRGAALYNDTGTREWMLRTCHTCGFCWPEQMPGDDDPLGAALVSFGLYLTGGAMTRTDVERELGRWRGRGE